MRDIAGAAATGALVTFVVLAVAGFVGLRLARRRYRTLRARLVAAVLPRGRGMAMPLLAVRSLPMAQGGWWSVQRDRRQLWRSVDAAEHAVRTAARSEVPVGDLPRLARDLRRAADDVDAALRAGLHAHDRIPAAVHRQRRQVQRTAEEICTAALNSLADGADVRARAVSEAVTVEVAALDAGLRAVRPAEL